MCIEMFINLKKEDYPIMKKNLYLISYKIIFCVPCLLFYLIITNQTNYIESRIKFCCIIFKGYSNHFGDDVRGINRFR